MPDQGAASVCYSVAPGECLCGASTKDECQGVGPDALEARAAALVEYGNSLPDGVTTEAFAEASNLRHEAWKLRQGDSAAPEDECVECFHVVSFHTGAPLDSCTVPGCECEEFITNEILND